VNAPLGFGGRYALDTVGTGFELQLAVDVVAFDPGNDFLVAAVLTLVFREDLHPPATFLGIPRVHAEQVAGEDRRLVATRAGADFEKHVAAVIGVLGQQHALQIALQFDQLFLGFADFLDSHFAHVRVAVLEQRLGTFEVGLHLQHLLVGRDNRFDFGVFLGIGAELGLIGNDFAIAEQGGQFLETVLEDVQLIEQ